MNLNASKADQWSVCTGLLDLEKNQNPIADRTAAEAGTVRHLVTEAVLGAQVTQVKGKVKVSDKFDFNAIQKTIVEEVWPQLTPKQRQVFSEDIEDMALAVEYLTTVVIEDILFDQEEREATKIVEGFWIENKMSKKGKGFEVKGTPDIVFWWYNHDMKSLHINVFDAKYGWGEVEANGNMQLAIYGHMCVDEIMKELKLKNVAEVNIRGVIVQPPLREKKTMRVYYDENFFEDLYVEPAQREFVVGRQCTYCDYNDVCPTFLKEVKQYLNPKFQDMTLDRRKEWPRLMEMQKPIVKMFEQMKSTVTDYVKGGVDLPGWELAYRSGHRAWIQGANIGRISKALGLPKSILLTDPSLRSPAQIEKELKAAGASAEQLEAFNDLIHAPQLWTVKQIVEEKKKRGKK